MTSYHVDVIQPDWAAGVERLAARLVLNGRGVEVTDSPDPDTWARKLLMPIPDRFGEMVGPENDPKLFLLAFVERHVTGTYIYALPPHEHYECPFDERSEVPMRGRSASPAHA
jgi:hypothetical protein